MAYATNADVEQRLGTQLLIQLTDDSNSGAPDQNKVTEALPAKAKPIVSPIVNEVHNYVYGVALGVLLLVLWSRFR